MFSLLTNSKTLIRPYSPLISSGLNARSRNGVACKLSLTLTAGANGKTSMLIKQQRRRRRNVSHEPALKEHPDLLVLQRPPPKHRHKAMGKMPRRTKRRNLSISAPFHIIPHNTFSRSVKRCALFLGRDHRKLFLFNLVSAAHRTTGITKKQVPCMINCIAYSFRRLNVA